MINLAQFNWLDLKNDIFRHKIDESFRGRTELKTKIKKKYGLKVRNLLFINVIKNIVWKEVLNSCILVANTIRQENINVPYPLNTFSSIQVRILFF